jgi:hypothetical protein
LTPHLPLLLLLPLILSLAVTSFASLVCKDTSRAASLRETFLYAASLRIKERRRRKGEEEEEEKNNARIIITTNLAS